MSDAQTPDGPDLRQGVPAADIAEGRMLAGRVGEAAVLVARVDGALYAIGSECPHYRGLLAEGLIVDGAVRCPWHHACFNLKTGEALAAPAFDPVPCWRVEEKDGRVTVGEKMTPAAPEKIAASAAAPPRAVIVGGGGAGFAAAEMLRRRGFMGAITLFSADVDAPYDRPNCSKDFLTGEVPAEGMPLKSADFYREQAIDLRLNTPVESFDPKAKTVTAAGAPPLPYDILILATGAEPVRPPIPGLDGPNVHLLRTFKDAEALDRAAHSGKRAVVIGASFIGLEAAAALVQRGLTVDVVAPEAVPLAKVMGRAIGAWVQGVHAGKGVRFHLGRKVLCVSGGQVEMDEGDPLPADLVVVGVGVTPLTALAEAAGLEVDDGVVVDDRLRTNAQGVYAIGDIARYPDPLSGRRIRVEHWVHAERQGQHVARLILGEDAPFADQPYFWSLHYDRSISYTGHAETFDPPEIDGSVEAEDAAVRFSREGRLLAVATVGRDLENLEAEAAFERT